MQSHIYEASGQDPLMSIIRVTSHERKNISNFSKLDCLLDSLFIPTTTTKIFTEQAMYYGNPQAKIDSHLKWSVVWKAIACNDVIVRVHNVFCPHRQLI